ncbi:MAG: branched-chain amino acid ABC transporter permease, partial [Actinobacteria bacterium]|nr:branched-chain amino acid ABC transporter permease [Actinomycetota bacterium]
MALAAAGLSYAVGLGGMASLGQGAFVAMGAFTVALLTSRAGWAPGPATVTAAGAGLAAGLIAGAGAVRLRGPFVAVSTWILAWLVWFGLGSFPETFGGSQGIRVGRPPGPGGALPGGELTVAGHFEVALGLLALAMLGLVALRRGPAGLALSAARQSPDAAAALGIRAERPQLGAFTASAAIGGLAGGLSVQLAGVADPGAYGPPLSVGLFVAVLVAGEGARLVRRRRRSGHPSSRAPVPA